MQGFGLEELFIIASIVLTVATWFYLFASGGNPPTVILLALVTIFVPVVGPLLILLFYRPGAKKKGK